MSIVAGVGQTIMGDTIYMFLISSHGKVYELEKSYIKNIKVRYPNFYIFLLGLEIK